MKNLLILSLLAMNLNACATYKPAVKTNIENSKKFGMSYDDTWKKIVSFATKNGMNIKTIDKASGLIAFERAYDVNASDAFMNCGNAHDSPLSVPAFGPLTSNITVNSLSPKETEVSVNLFESVSYPPASAHYECYSKGIFEKQLFCDVDGHPCPEAIPSPTPKPTAKQY